jgi:hypothetical protein
MDGAESHASHVFYPIFPPDEPTTPGQTVTATATDDGGATSKLSAPDKVRAP